MENNSEKSKIRPAKILWVSEVVKYLGLDRLGLARPDKAVYRLVEKGALNPIKICGHLAFSKSEVDRLLTNGDQKPRRGRPRKSNY